jgi:uncharacterized membrane protein
MTTFVRWISWNLMLAVIPVVLGYALAWGLAGRGTKRRLPPWICAPLAILWIGFLPNSCYLLTEWRHLLIDPRWAPVVGAAQENDRYAMLALARWALFFIAYSGAGVLLFALAVRPVERWLASTGRPMFIVAPVLFSLTSLGVYLGLVSRLNTWYLLNHPHRVWLDTVHAVTSATILSSILVFAGVLWALYEAVDLWVDGVAARLKRLAPPAPARAQSRT